MKGQAIDPIAAGGAHTGVFLILLATLCIVLTIEKQIHYSMRCDHGHVFHLNRQDLRPEGSCTIPSV